LPRLNLPWNNIVVVGHFCLKNQYNFSRVHGRHFTSVKFLLDFENNFSWIVNPSCISEDSNFCKIEIVSELVTDCTYEHRHMKL
jgi:hypothetical protein